MRISPCEQAWPKTSSSDAVTGNTVRQTVTLCSQYRNKCAIFAGGSSAKLSAIQSLDSCLAFRVIVHRHECEASRTASLLIIYDFDFCDASKLLEDCVNVSLDGVGRKIPNIEFHGVVSYTRLPALHTHKSPHSGQQLKPVKWRPARKLIGRSLACGGIGMLYILASSSSLVVWR